MKAKKKDNLPYVLLGSALLFFGLATYVYLNTRIAEDAIDFDLWDEDISNYA